LAIATRLPFRHREIDVPGVAAQDLIAQDRTKARCLEACDGAALQIQP
jgi:hypothetical protein